MSTMPAVGTTEAVFGHHLQALMARSVDEIVSDYIESSVVFTQNGTFRGLEQIRAFFTEGLKIFTPEVLGALKVSEQSIDGEFAYVVWSAGEAILLGMDTFCIRDGKIIMQAFVAQFGAGS
jgi:hypothetical protein